MARIQTFARDLQLATAGLQPQNIAAALAAFAKAELSKAIASGEGSPDYDIYVNGTEGAAETDVVPPGPILYVFNWWDEIVRFALQLLVERSPVRSGRYQRNWIIRANGSLIANPKDIGIASVIELTNIEPYHRKIDVGHMRMSVPHGLIEDARAKVMSIWGNLITAKRTLIQLPGGYVLKGHFRRGVRPHSRTKLQKDTQRGAPMLYPTLRLETRSGIQ